MSVAILSQAKHYSLRIRNQSHLHMKRGFLLHNRSAVSQRVATTSAPSLHSVMLAHLTIMERASALAFLTGEPAVLWLCRHQERNEATMHFQKQAREADDRLAEYMRKALAFENLYANPVFEALAMARLAEGMDDDATKRRIIKELRKQVKEYWLDCKDWVEASDATG